MRDPNLQKIINHNIHNIKKNILGTTIVQASSYLNFIYYGEKREKRQQELDDFIEDIKLLSNKFKIQKLKYRIN
jgi:hypothetical protein